MKRKMLTAAFFVIIQDSRLHLNNLHADGYFLHLSGETGDGSVQLFRSRCEHSKDSGGFAPRVNTVLPAAVDRSITVDSV